MENKNTINFAGNYFVNRKSINLIYLTVEKWSKQHNKLPIYVRHVTYYLKITTKA